MIRQYFRNRFMYRLASSGLITPPCGVPRLLLLAARHAPLPFLVPLFDRCLQPHLDQMQHVPIDDAPRHALHQFAVRDRVEVFGQIGVHHIGVAGAESSCTFWIASCALRSGR